MSQGDQTTRYLASCAFLRGSGFRKWVLDFVRDPQRAVVPEMGLDLRLLAGVCQYAERSDRIYALGFFGLEILVAAFTILGCPPELVIFLFVGTAGLLWFQKRRDRDTRILPSFKRSGFDPGRVTERFLPSDNALPPDALPLPEQNLIVYSGFSPFVGSGADLGGWSFAVATDKAKDSFSGDSGTLPFTPQELQASLTRALDRLDLPGLDCREMFFVRGVDLRNDRSILPDLHGRPLQTVISEFPRARPTDARVRGYLRIVTEDWRGDLITSYFLRVYLKAPTLYIELKKFVLTPVGPEFQQIDAICAPPTLRGTLATLALAPFGGVIDSIAAPFVLLDAVNRAVEHRRKCRRRRRVIEESPLYDYGSSTSVRAAYASGSYAHHFQRSDADLYVKTLDREILDQIVTFLDNHNVDTSDLKERQSTILNSGIIGNVQADPVSVGTGARTSFIASLRQRGKKHERAKVPA